MTIEMLVDCVEALGNVSLPSSDLSDRCPVFRGKGWLTKQITGHLRMLETSVQQKSVSDILCSLYFVQRTKRHQK